MEQTKAWKNRSKLLDSFEFNFDLRLKDADFWRNLYLVEGLSATQIADRLKTPRSTIHSLLRRHGIRKEQLEGCSTQPDNYLAPNPPYGFKVEAGRLLIDRKEMKVCKLIVELRRNQNWDWSAIAKELSRRQIPTRRNDEGTRWHRHIVRAIFERWHSKI